MDNKKRYCSFVLLWDSLISFQAIIVHCVTTLFRASYMHLTISSNVSTDYYVILNGPIWIKNKLLGHWSAVQNLVSKGLFKDAFYQFRKNAKNLSLELYIRDNTERWTRKPCNLFQSTRCRIWEKWRRISCKDIFSNSCNLCEISRKCTFLGSFSWCSGQTAGLSRWGSQVRVPAPVNVKSA